MQKIAILLSSCNIRLSTAHFSFLCKCVFCCLCVCCRCVCTRSETFVGKIRSFEFVNVSEASGMLIHNIFIHSWKLGKINNDDDKFTHFYIESIRACVFAALMLLAALYWCATKFITSSILIIKFWIFWLWSFGFLW